MAAMDVTADAALPAGIDENRAPKPKMARDEIAQRGLVLIVIAYLFVGLVLPIGTVFIKAAEEYVFSPAQVEIAFQRDGAWEEPRTLQSWLDETGEDINDGLRPSERTRAQIVNIIPKPARRGVDLFRITDTSSSGGLILYDSKFSAAGETIEVERRRIGRVQVRPQVTYGLGNFSYYFGSATLTTSIFNSILIALIVVAIVVPLAFGFAYGLTRTYMPAKGVFRLIATIPVLVPSLLPALGLVYLFGNQGLIKGLLLGESIYGPIGIVMASVFFTFPHAMIIMIVALSASDQRLYEAAEVLGASKWRTFWTVTIPGAQYGLISAAFVVFTLVITDFGVPKVIGGNYNMLALDIYKQVVGQQNFQIGAVVSIVLLLPAIIAFTVDRLISSKQVALMSAKAVPLTPKIDPQRDAWLTALCSAVAFYIVGILAMCQIAALVRFWPYNMELGFWHYDFDRMDGGGWSSYYNSIQLAVLSATAGVAIVFLGAYLVEKVREFQAGRIGLQFLAMMPMAIPGMVLGLAYVFFFNELSNPLHLLYGTMAILVINTTIHLYTVSHLTAATALKQMDKEFEAVSMSLKQPFWRTMTKVSVPVCFPAISEIWLYYFVNAMTTVSAVVFLYSPSTQLASIAVLNMDDAGDIAPAAAMGMMIFYTNAVVRILHGVVTRRWLASLQEWRKR